MSRAPKFSRADLEKMAGVLGLNPAGLSDGQLLDALSRELAKRKDELRKDPAGEAARRLEL